MASDKLTRVELEREDGSIKRLTGAQALEWDRACSGIAHMAAVHGAKFPAFKWEEAGRPAVPLEDALSDAKELTERLKGRPEEALALGLAIRIEEALRALGWTGSS